VTYGLLGERLTATVAVNGPPERRRPPKRALEAFYHPFAQLSASFDELVPVADA
jgi:hypothetical protein